LALAPATQPANAPTAPQPLVIVGESSRSIEPSALARRREWRPRCGFELSRFRIQLGDDLLDHHRLFETCDDLHCTAAGQARLNVDVKDGLQPLRASFVFAE
jgi:hypothetical protein